MAIDKLKIRVINKLIDNGYTTEKAITNFGVADMQNTRFNSSDELDSFISLQEAVKKNKVIEYLAGNDDENPDD